MSRRFRSFLLCLAASAILPLVLPGVASGAPDSDSATSGGQVTGGGTAPARGAAGDASGIPTRFAGGCESRHHPHPSSAVTDLQQHT